MNLIVQIVLETENGPYVQELARLERQGASLENIGLTLAESKQLLAALQACLVDAQIAEYLEGQRRCVSCGTVRAHNSTHEITFQSLFGTLKLNSPRWKHCACHSQASHTFSPLALLLTEHVSPESLFLETKWVR